MRDAGFSEATFRALSVATGALLLLAAVTKFGSPLEIAQSISFVLFGRPSASAVPHILAMVVVIFEILLGLALVLTRPGRWLLLGTMALITAFTLALARLSSLDGAPDCGCFSLGKLREREASGAGAGILRNGALLVAILWMHRHARSGRTSPEGGPARGRGGSRHAHGFTLIELIISIAVIALLIALAIPSLAGARMRAKMAWSLSTQRQIGAAIHLYAQDHGETFPTVGEPERLGGGLVGPRGDTIGSEYFQSSLYRWSTLLFPHYVPTLSTLKPGVRNAGTEQIEDGWIRSTYLLTYNAWADPRYWNEDSPTPVRPLLRATRVGEVRFPSEKGLVLDVHHGAMNRNEFPGYRNLSVGRADGSAGELDWWSVPLSAVYSNPRWPVPWRLPVLATRDGLWGRDFNIPRAQTP